MGGAGHAKRTDAAKPPSKSACAATKIAIATAILGRPATDLVYTEPARLAIARTRGRQPDGIGGARTWDRGLVARHVRCSGSGHRPEQEGPMDEPISTVSHANRCKAVYTIVSRSPEKRIWVRVGTA